MTCIINRVPVKTQKAPFLPFYRRRCKILVGQVPITQPRSLGEEVGFEPRDVGHQSWTSRPPPPCVSLRSPYVDSTWMTEVRGGGTEAHSPPPPPPPASLPAALRANSEDRAWPKKCKKRRNQPPFPPSLPTSASACVQTWVGGPDSWLRLQPKYFPCSHGINFPKELLSEFDLREPSVSPKNHHLSCLTLLHSTFQLIHQEALFNNEQRESVRLASPRACHWPAVDSQPIGTCCPLPAPTPLQNLMALTPWVSAGVAP